MPVSSGELTTNHFQNKKKRTLRFFFQFLVLCSIFITQISSAQKNKKIEILNANTLEYDQSLGNNARKLIGDVAFKHEGAIMKCDSAYLYSESNSMDAFGNVHINQGDTINIYGDTLKYNGNSKNAELLGNIRFIDKDMTLITSHLNYDLKNSMGYYFGGGTITSLANQNKLTSQQGYYYSKNKELFFKEKVVLINPEYEIYSDTLKYHTTTEISYFLGPTIIQSKDNLIYCENGWYDTQKDISQFKKNAYIITKEQKLQGDSLYYDRNNGIGKAFKNVQITDTIKDFIINGDYAIHYEKENNSIITGNTMLTMIMESDSLFLHADTLKATYDSTKTDRIIYAYHKTKFFKRDLQGMCDSLVYTFIDSTIRLYKDPVLWSEENQMIAEHIQVKTSDGKVQYLKLDRAAFIISQEDSTRFNQVKGKNMMATFLDNELYKVDVTGNGQTIYYLREDKGELFGVNKAESSDLTIYIKENAVDKISFINKPEATLYPIDKLPAEETILKDFVWKIEFRPLSKQDIFVWKN